MTPRLGRYFWKLFLLNAALMALVLAGCVWVIISQFDRFHEEELTRHLFAQAAALEVAVHDQFDRRHADELNTLAGKLGSTEREGSRVTFVLADGKVLGDSEANAAEMESHADRPEIREALATGTGESMRWSHTVDKNMKYVAVRVGVPEHPLGVVRVSMALQSIAARAQPAQRLAVVIALVSVLAAILLALALALLWSRRIHRLTEAASSLSGGDLSARVKVVGHDEIAMLGRSLNKMRARLSTHLQTIDRQRRTLESLISQLREGVVVADAAGRVVLINDEAAEMLQPSPVPPGGSHVGRSVEQCIPHLKLQDLLLRPGSPSTSDAAVSPELTDRHSGTRLPRRTHEIELRLSTATGDRSVLARAFDVRLPESTGDGLSSGKNPALGRALVLTDITELTRVMQVKADLAANASHELRTPLSAIRAAVDTLHSIDSSSDPAATAQFIDVIDRHSGRMEAMISDLLELSRLESGSGRFDVGAFSSKMLLEEFRMASADALSAKNLRWKTSIPQGDITLTASAELLRIILRNLIDNAIRFTDSGGDITLSACKEGDTVAFEVADTGCGIAPEEQQRVFERFYQVERARSGPDRGTGLGLSIVRHAATAMNAQIDLKSTPGQGTCVTIRLPLQA